MRSLVSAALPRHSAGRAAGGPESAHSGQSIMTEPRLMNSRGRRFFERVLAGHPVFTPGTLTEWAMTFEECAGRKVGWRVQRNDRAELGVVVAIDHTSPSIAGWTDVEIVCF